MLSLCAAAQASKAPNPLILTVDATDVDHRVLHAMEDIPVVPGKVTLFYPEWLPGTHSTNFSSMKRLAGLRFVADGRPITWTRDTVDMGAFHLDVPSGVTEVRAEFDYLTPSSTTGDNSRVSMSQAIVNVEWHSVLLYPAQTPVDQIPITASVKLPSHWDFACALEISRTEGDIVGFKTTDVGTLVDSPLLAGRYFRKYDLDPGGPVAVSLDVAADRPDELVATADELAAHRALVAQAMKLYGSRHYDHYDFLMSISDTIGGIGLEHHQSSEDAVEHGYFTEWSDTWDQRDLLPHEYTHSWNGKFRRPADLTTANYNVPMRDTLLWMYEGQTEFWGKVLAVRSGLVSAEQAREGLAFIAGYFAQLPARAWRNLQDTTNEEILSRSGAVKWPTWQRGADYYDEMVLVWLDVDSQIRERSGGKRSLDDFARSFLGVDSGSHRVKTYTIDDVVAALNAVQPGDWKTFLRGRLDQLEPRGLLDGLTRSGWELTYSDEPNQLIVASEKHNKDNNFGSSIGLTVGKDDKIIDVVWNGPAFAAGVAPENTLVAVDGRAYDKDVLSSAIIAAETSDAPIELLIRDGDLYRSTKVNYHHGLHNPHLTRIDGRPDLLTPLFSAR